VDNAAVGRITTARDLDSIVLRQVRDVLARLRRSAGGYHTVVIRKYSIRPGILRASRSFV
jgi:hypothetical protein